MSLRTVHLVFIVASVGVSVLMAAWFVVAYRADGSALNMVGGVLSMAAGVVLLVYGTRYRIKTAGIDAPDTSRPMRRVH